MSNGHFDVGLLIRTLTRGGQFDLVYHLVYAPTPHPRPGPHHVKKSQRNQEKDKPRAAFVSLLDGNLALVKTDPRHV